MKNINRLIFEKQISTEYLKYQQFMNVSNMPKYYLQWRPQQGTTIAEERFENNRYNLIISDTLFLNHKKEAKGILFHEFTHILDEECLCQQYGFLHENRIDSYVYKEIHAEQIKTLMLLGYDNINAVKDSIDWTKKNFVWNGKILSIFDYLMETRQDLYHDIESIELALTNNAKISLNEFNNILNRIFYYMGTASVYLKYYGDNEWEKINIQYVCDFYQYGMSQLFKEVIQNNIGFHTKEWIEAMGKVRILIINHYKDLIEGL